jgi:hypothetical protein
VGLWPNFERGERIGGRYEKINGLLLRLSSDLKIDLWTLDALWWFLLGPDRLPQTVREATQQTASGGNSFALERQLEEFLLERALKNNLAVCDADIWCNSIAARPCFV